MLRSIRAKFLQEPIFEYSCRAAFFLALVAIGLLSITTSGPLSEPLLWDKLNHFVAFFTLIIFFDLGWPHKPHFWIKVTLLFLFGIGIEVAQSFQPPRQASALDVVADVVGLLSYVCIRPWWRQHLAAWRAPGA